jgi:hypothetical protein
VLGWHERANMVQQVAATVVFRFFVFIALFDYGLAAKLRIFVDIYKFPKIILLIWLLFCIFAH